MLITSALCFMFIMRIHIKLSNTKLLVTIDCRWQTEDYSTTNLRQLDKKIMEFLLPDSTVIFSTFVKLSTFICQFFCHVSGWCGICGTKTESDRRPAALITQQIHPINHLIFTHITCPLYLSDFYCYKKISKSMYHIFLNVSLVHSLQDWNPISSWLIWVASGEDITAMALWWAQVCKARKTGKAQCVRLGRHKCVRPGR